MTANSTSANSMNESMPDSPKVTLPAWRVILEMIRFRTWFWLADLLSALFFRFC